MKNIIALGILALFCFTITAQEEEPRIPFSAAISAHIAKYNQRIDAAYKDNDLERAKFLFDSLVSNHLRGTYMDNFKITPLKGEPIQLQSFDRPIFLVSYASWCVPGIGEIPAFNDLADKFHDQIDFVVLFWDSREKLKEKEKDYSENVKLMFVDERSNQNSYVVNKLKHALGFPMTYFMDEEKRLLDIRKVETHHSSETLSNSYNIHFNSLSKGVSLLIADLEAKGLLGKDLSEEDKELLDEELEVEDRDTTNSYDNEEEISDDEGYLGYDPDNDNRTQEEIDIDAEYERYQKEKKAAERAARKKRKKKKKKDN